MNIEAHLRKVAEIRTAGPSTLNGPIRLAILDDYQHVANAIFARHLGPRVEIHSFPYTLNSRVSSERNELIKRLAPFDVISTMRERTAFTAEVLAALPKLKLLLTTGMNNASIDVAACAERGILVVGTKGSKIAKTNPSTMALSPSLQATAEQTLALILSVTKVIPRNQSDLAQGGWQTGFVSGLAGKTLGVVGLGRIGAMVARMAILGFGMHVVAWSSSLTQEKANEQMAELGVDKSTYQVKVAASKLDLFREADVVSLHYVLSDRSRNMVSSEELAAMKSTGILVNTSRGGLIDEPVLLRTLKQGRIRGVGLDVFTVEPLPTDSEWRTTRWGEDGAGYAVLSPHMGYAEENVIHGWYEESAIHLSEFLEGRTPDAVIAPKS